VQSRDVVEASGLAASAIHAGVYYANNDSGDSARFFAIGSDGSDRGTFDVEGANAFDWEDLSRGPCKAGGSCVYLADIGDNNLVRDEYVVYRVAEPVTVGPGVQSVRPETFRFVYPDGPHNAETLLVHPKSGVVTIVTKDAGETLAFELPMPLDATGVMTAIAIGEATVPGLLGLVTGGDIHPDGSSVLLRTYRGLFLYTVASGQSAAQALAARPCEMPAGMEQQGEAVAWTMDGHGYVTLSEGASKPLLLSTCR
jgi:hypothetical protein